MNTGAATHMRRVLLADVGDLDFGLVIPALAERYAASVVTLTLDVGQAGPVAASRARALAAGAVRAHVVDVRDEFAREGLLRLLQAGALRADDLSLPEAFLRMLTAERLLEVAAMEGTSLVAHGAEPGSEAAAHLARVIARQRREGFVIAAGSGGHRVRAPRAGRGAECIRSTLWWREYAAGERESPRGADPDGTALVEVAFAGGVPVALNGVEMPLLELIEAADTIADDHRVGRTVLPDPGGAAGALLVRETPAAAVLVTAHAALTRAALSHSLHLTRRHAAGRYVKLLQDGEWRSDAREALDAFFAEAQKRVSGTVRLRLSHGRCRVLARTVEDPAVAGAAAPARPLADVPSSRTFVSH